MAVKDITLLKDRLFSIELENDFNDLCFDIFHLQHERLPIYREFCDLIGINVNQVSEINQIPFLPISFFKNHDVILNGLKEEVIFRSSGTTNSTRSRHLIADRALYERSLNASFSHFISDPEKLKMFSLLPNYAENPDSSLIHMVRELSQNSIDAQLHSFDNSDGLIEAMKLSEKEGNRNILFCVSFALIDLAEKLDIELKNTVILETGGMKGRGKEIIRSELHSLARKKLRPLSIVSEYGMTELLSQAYALDSEFFKPPPWMRIFVRDSQDPLSISNSGSGAINVIDLANICSCSFIATDDLGQMKEDGSFSVLGRFDHSDIRGCNLMYDL